MPELENLELADDPIPTHGTTEGQRMELPPPRISMEEMLALANARKCQQGSAANAKPHEGDSIPMLPATAREIMKPTVLPAIPPSSQGSEGAGNSGKKRKVVGGKGVGQKKKKKKKRNVAP